MKQQNFKYFRQPTLIGLLKQKNYPKFLVVMQNLILLPKKMFRSYHLQQMQSSSVFCLFLLEFPHYAVLNFSLTNLFVRNREQLENNGNSSEEVASSSQETGSPNEYENTLSDGTPVPAQTRGIVPYERDYKNTSLSWYDKLQTIRPLAIDWLRNTWGNIDEFGRHVYDTIKRIPHIFATYDKIRNAARDDLNENGATSSSNTYDNMERLPPVTLPSRRESVLSATENV